MPFSRAQAKKNFSILFLPRHKNFKRFDLVIYMPKKRFLAKIWGRGVVFSKIEKNEKNIFFLAIMKFSRVGFSKKISNYLIGVFLNPKGARFLILGHLFVDPTKKTWGFLFIFG